MGVHSAILSMEIGGNLKYCLVLVKNSEANLVKADELVTSNLNMTIYELKVKLKKAVGNVLSDTRYVLVSFPGAASLQYKSPVLALEELKEVLVNTFNEFEDLEFLIYGRDGNFYSIEEAIRSMQESRNYYFYLDNYWLGGVELAKELFKTSSFLYLDMGSYSFSLIPVINGKPIVESDENRLLSGKLTFVGVKNTPVLLIANEIRLGTRRIKPCLYVPLYTKDIFEEGNRELLQLKVSRLIGLFETEPQVISEIIQSLSQELSGFVKESVDKIVAEYFDDEEEVKLVLAGKGKQYLQSILKNHYSEIYILPWDNVHACLGMSLSFIKKKFGARPNWTNS